MIKIDIPLLHVSDPVAAEKNVDSLNEEFVARGVQIDLPPTDQSWGNREMYIRDRDNNSIRFTQWMQAQT